MKVYLSPSDQWSNIVADGKHSEAFHCIKIAEYARAYLELNGYDVKVGSSVKENTYKARVKESNEWNADLHIPIRTNAGGGHGTLMLCYPARTNNRYVRSIYNEVTEKWIDEHEKELGRAIAIGVCVADGKTNFEEVANQKEIYKVQVGAFHIRKNAENLKKELSDKGYNCYIVEG